MHLFHYSNRFKTTSTKTALTAFLLFSKSYYSLSWSSAATYRTISSFRTMSTSTTTNPTEPKRNLGYVDVHAHLIHEKFVGKEADIAQHCIDMGMDHVIINGLEPISNRQILSFCEQFPQHMIPALGIYPLDAANKYIYSEEDVTKMQEEGCPIESLPEVNWKHPFPRPTRFDVDEEIDFIEQMIQEKRIIAIGECGMDKHYLTDNASLLEQERVLRKLMKLSVQYDIPVILHTRKMEKKVLEMLIEEGVKKADFHCFCGKLKLGVEIAQAGYYLSIPSAVVNNSSFQKLATAIPLERLLTETDSPYMGPVKGEDNIPSTVIQSIDTIAALRNMPSDELRSVVRKNYQDLFGR